jgi:hypothetical protein
MSDFEFAKSLPYRDAVNLRFGGEPEMSGHAPWLNLTLSSKTTRTTKARRRHHVAAIRCAGMNCHLRRLAKELRRQ